MRRALAILKYVPAVLCGLLVVAWVVSMSVPIGGECVWRDGRYIVRIWRGIIKASFGPKDTRWFSEVYFPDDRLKYSSFVKNDGRRAFEFFTPISIAILLSLPLALAPFTRFRFPLWSYFAWTALVAAELAYYLR
jgi:hypothetical protein